MAADALRVLALAYKPVTEPLDVQDESGLTLLGLVGMKDPPREEAREAVRRCYLAGIRPVMITGDHPATALAIARELGIARPGDAVVSGNDLDRLSDEDLRQRSIRSTFSHASLPSISCESFRRCALTIMSSR